MEETNITTAQQTAEAQTEQKGHKSRKPLVVTILIAIVVLVLAILISSSKPAKIHRLSKFTQRVEQEYTSYSSSDLEKAEAKFEKYVSKLDKCELNGKQETKVNELKGECRGYFTQARARIILQDFKNAVDAAGAEVKGAIKSLNGEE